MNLGILDELLALNHSLHYLPCRIKDNVDQCVQWRVRILFLSQPLSNILCDTSCSHVACVVANNRTDSANLLNNIAQIVDKEVESLPAIRD